MPRRTLRVAAFFAQVSKLVSPYTFHYYFATYFKEAEFDIHIVQELLGHKDGVPMCAPITLIYNRVLKYGLKAVRSPLD